MAIQKINVDDITHTSVNTSLKFVTLNCEVNGETVQIVMHPAVLFAASQQAMASFQYALECEANGVDPTAEQDGY